MMKRTLSLLLALIMVVGLLPNTWVFAADANDDIYIDESSSLDELEDLGIVDIPEDIPDVDGIPEDDISDMEWTSEENHIFDEDAVIDNPETSPRPKEPDPEQMEEELPDVETPDPLPEDADASDVHQETVSGSIGGTVTEDMTVSYTTNNQDMVWKANATGADVDQSGAKIDTSGGYPYYSSGTHTIQIVPDAEAASVEGVTQLHVNLFQVQVLNGANLHIYLDEEAFAAYPNVTEVVLHSVYPERSLMIIRGGSLTLEGLPGCRLVLDGGQTDGTVTKNKLLYLGYGDGAGSVNIDYVTFRNCDGSAIYARGGLMESVSVSNCYFESTCRNTTADGGAICFFPYYDETSTAVESLTVSNCIFDGNSAARQGGAVSLFGAFDQVEISGSTFTGTSVTRSDWRGGALALNGFFNEVTVSGNTFTDCTAASYGGAIGVLATIGKLTVSSDFINCSAQSGGAICLSTGEMDINNFKFTGVTTSPYARINTLNIDGSDFSDCSSDSYRGGAICIAAQIRAVSVTNSSFTNCSSGTASGGGICFGYMEDLPSDVSWSTETWLDMTGLQVESYAGGDVWSEIWSTTLNGNASIVTTMGSVTVENTTFDGCEGSFGGGFYLQNPTSIDTFLLKDVEVKNCQATGYNGGGIGFASYAEGKSITITNVKIHDNVSARNGGGLYINAAEETTVSISGSQVYGNIVGAYRDSSGSIAASGTSTLFGDGGGIYLTGSTVATVTVSDSIIGAKLQDTENDDGETVQTLVSAPNFAYCYVKETVVTEATDNEPAQIEREHGGGGRGGGLYVSEVKLELKGTKVMNNEADYTAGGIGTYSGAVLSTDSNTDVSYNTAPRGGGICINASAVPDGQYALEMVGSTVSHNRGYQTELLQGTGGGIYMGYAKVKLVGVTVSDNICANVVDGEYVFSSETVDSLYGGGLAVYYRSTLEFYGGSILRNQASNGAGIALYTGSSVSLKPDENGVGVQVKDNIADGIGGGIHVMTRYGTLNNSATIEGATITGNKAGNGHFGGDGGGIAVSTGGTVEIINTQIGNNSAGVGYVAETKDGKTVYVNGEPKWILAKDADENPEYIEGGTAPKEIYGYGGGIYCFGSSATIRGCEIHNNTSGRRGGGVYGENGSSIEIYNITAEDGTVTRSHIHHNETRDYAGGIGSVGRIVRKTDDEGKTIKENNIIVIDEEKSDGATLRLDGTLVEYNETTRYGGGGIYISSLAVCDIVNQAVVQENTSKTHAGGIMANIWGTINVTDAQVIRNKAGSNGGGVYVSSHSEVVITDGEINYNTAAGHGGGIEAGGTADWGGSGVTITGGEISYNTAARNGGGVYAVGSNNTYQEHSSTVLIKEGTTISYNKSESEAGFGGGVYVGQLSTVTIEGGLITENTAAGYGGGVTGNNKATVTVAGGQVFRNYAGSAGGIYVGGESKVYVNDGLIKKNIAAAIWKESTKELLYGNGGGVMATDTAQIIISGGEITENEAKSCEYYTNEDETEKSKEQTETCTVLTRDGGIGGGVYATGNAGVLLQGGSVTLNDARYGGGICSNNQASVTVQGGSVAENIASERGGGIYAGGASTVTMEPKKGDDTSIGSITGNTATLEGGGIYATGSAEVTLTKGNIQSNTAKDGGGIYAGGVEDGHSTVIVDGGKIGGFLEDGTTSGGNTANGGNGGGIYAVCGAEVTVSDGQITGNHAVIIDSAGGDGGGIYATGYQADDIDYGSGAITVTGGEISSNIADGNGGGIYATVTSSVLVNGGNVKQNHAVNGAGICSNDQASVTVQGGSVAGNIASERGGGIYAGGASTVTMEPKEGDDTSTGSITGNTATLEGGGVYATDTAQVTLTKGNIQSNTAKDGGGIYASGANGGHSTITVDGGMIGGLLEDGSSGGNTADGGNGGGIYATGGAEVKLQKGDVTGNTAGQDGGGIYGGSDEGGGGKITLSGGTVEGNTAERNGGGIYAKGESSSEPEGASHVYVNGGTIEGNTARNGGGIYGTYCATVQVDKGEIIHNEASNGGGGMYVVSGANAAVSGGKINDNEALSTSTGGGGIYIGSSGTVTVSGGELNNNTAVISYGGGIFMYHDATMEVTAGKITNNHAAKAGGGVFLYADKSTVPTLTVAGGEISGNIAQSGNGGGIFATGIDNESVCSITVNDGLISDNEAIAGQGGGIALVRKSTCTINGGTITDNTATRVGTTDTGYGGGVYMGGVATLTVNGGTISWNEAYNGGGIYATGSEGVMCTVQGGEIIRNTASNNGGGIGVAGLADVLVQGGMISENTAVEDGGGIYIGSSSGRATVTITKTTVNGVNTVGTVKNNTADNGGGVYVSRGGDLIVNEGHIINNTAVAPQNAQLPYSGKGLSASLHGAGGGICVASNDTGTAIFTLTGTADEQTGKMNMAIYGNTATYSGDEVFSNGKNTSLTVPLVSQMNLEGYEFDIVGWFEDYNTGDTLYHNGLNRKGLTDSAEDLAKVKRYRNSTATDRQIITDEYVNGSGLADGIQYVNLDNAYVAMALGIPNATNDTVVVDYGMSVDIDILSNDMLLQSEGEGMNPATDSKLGMTLPGNVAADKEILYSPKKDSNDQIIDTGFKRYLTTEQEATINLELGTANWKKDGTVETGILRYSMKDMKMDTEEVFYYVVPGENFYYYAAVTVVPATSIYYEDNSGFVTYHETNANETLAKWEPVPGATVNGAQDQDRPGMSSILEGLDADNIYGYDSSYATSSTYSGGSAYKVTVSQHKAQDKIANNGLCDYLDKVTGKRCYRKVSHTYQNNGFGKCSVCLNTEDKHRNDIPTHECTDGNNYNEYCDVCSKWIGMHTTSARASFTFTGTGFDIVSLCSNNTGLVLVNVFRGEVTDFNDPSIYNEDTYVMSYMVDTYYGYKYENGEWVVDPAADSTLYQVPVIKADLTKVVWSPDDPSTPEDETVYKNFGYDTYTVELVVGTSWTPGSPTYNNAEFYLDAIRIYNPVGISGSEGEVVQDAYLADGEAWPAYAELRNLFIEQGDLQDENPMVGVLFIDGQETPTLETYRAWGPNNEIYLNPGQSLAFTVDTENYGEDIAAIHLGVRGLTGKGTVLIQAKDKNDSEAPVETILSRDISTTDLYYDISHKVDGVVTIANKVVTITNPAKVKDAQGNEVENKAPIAISNLKVTHNSEPGKRNGSNQSGTGEFTGYSINRMVRVDSQTAQIALEILTAEVLADPVVAPKYPALSFNGMVCYNVFFSAEELGDLTAADLGLAVFTTEDTDGTVETADEVHLGATEIDGLYMVATDGVHAKFLGDTKYFRAFAKKADGSYVYSKMVSYSALEYAANVLAKSNDVALKQLMVAMLNYGAEAQKFFGYKTDDLMNKDLTADHQALLAGFDASYLNSVGKVDVSKVGAFVSNKGFTKRSPAISFKGAFEINYFFTPAYAVDGNMTLYVWNEDTYNSVNELTAGNADKAVTMTLENGTYTASSDEIIAKHLDKTVYVAAVYESAGMTYCSGVLSYSIAAYCQNPPDGVQDLATAAAVYGCTAKQYFGA